MNKKQVFRLSLTFGLIAGVVCFIYFITMYFMVDNPLSVRRPDLGINIILIASAIWYFKRLNGGYLHFYEAFSVGFLTNIIGALLTGVLIYLFLQFIDIQPFKTWMSESRQMLIDDRERSKDLMNEQTFQNLLKSFDNRNPAVIIWDELFFKQLAVIAVSLLGMGMRKVKPI